MIYSSFDFCTSYLLKETVMSQVIFKSLILLFIYYNQKCIHMDKVTSLYVQPRVISVDARTFLNRQLKIGFLLCFPNQSLLTIFQRVFIFLKAISVNGNPGQGHHKLEKIIWFGDKRKLGVSVRWFSSYPQGQGKASQDHSFPILTSRMEMTVHLSC